MDFQRGRTARFSPIASNALKTRKPLIRHTACASRDQHTVQWPCGNIQRCAPGMHKRCGYKAYLAVDVGSPQRWPPDVGHAEWNSHATAVGSCCRRCRLRHSYVCAPADRPPGASLLQSPGVKELIHRHFFKAPGQQAHASIADRVDCAARGSHGDPLDCAGERCSAWPVSCPSERCA